MIDLLHTYQFRDENGLTLAEAQLADYEAAYVMAEDLADHFKCPITIVEVHDTARPVVGQKANG